MLDGCGRNALHLAAACGNAAMCRLLLEFGLEGNILDSFGWSPSHYAAANDHGKVLAVFMEYGEYCSCKSTTPMRMQVSTAYVQEAKQTMSDSAAELQKAHSRETGPHCPPPAPTLHVPGTKEEEQNGTTYVLLPACTPLELSKMLGQPREQGRAAAYIEAWEFGGWT